MDPFSVTIGVSAFPALATERQQLLHQADAALYWGKRHGRTDVQLFDPAGTAWPRTGGRSRSWPRPSSGSPRAAC